MEEKPRKRRDKYAASAERDVVEPTAMSSAVDSHTDSTMLTHCGGCLSDCSVCCYGLWCCCCMLGDNDKRVDGAVERNSRLCCCAVLLPCVACCGTFGAYKRLRIRYDYKVGVEFPHTHTTLRTHTHTHTHITSIFSFVYTQRVIQKYIYVLICCYRHTDIHTYTITHTNTTSNLTFIHTHTEIQGHRY